MADPEVYPFTVMGFGVAGFAVSVTGVPFFINRQYTVQSEPGLAPANPVRFSVMVADSSLLHNVCVAGDKVTVGSGTTVYDLVNFGEGQYLSVGDCNA